MRSVLAPAPYPEPTSRLNSVTREDSFFNLQPIYDGAIQPKDTIVNKLFNYVELA